MTMKPLLLLAVAACSATAALAQSTSAPPLVPELTAPCGAQCPKAQEAPARPRKVLNATFSSPAEASAATWVPIVQGAAVQPASVVMPLTNGIWTRIAPPPVVTNVPDVQAPAPAEPSARSPGPVVLVPQRGPAPAVAPAEPSYEAQELTPELAKLFGRAR